MLYGGTYTERERLTSTFLPREKYIVHYINLQIYLRLGLRVTKVHQILGFTQSCFMKTYVDYCTNKRKEATSEFGKNVFKLCVNAVFGKTIENVRSYTNIVLCTTQNQLDREILKTSFKDAIIINDNFVAVLLEKNQIKLNKPISIGFTILERSKAFMYESYYDNINPVFSKCEVIFSDTDSLCLKVITKPKENPLEKLAHIMDFSNYPPTNSLYNADRKNELFFFKDELKSERMVRFCGLRAKSYAYQTKKTKKITLKGVTKAYRKDLCFKVFERALRYPKNITTTQYTLRSRNHKVTMDKNTRIALTSFDSNRYLFKCGIHTVPYGSIAIQKNKCHQRDCPK